MEAVLAIESGSNFLINCWCWETSHRRVLAFYQALLYMLREICIDVIYFGSHILIKGIMHQIGRNCTFGGVSAQY
mgnify:FL=1